MPVIAQRFDPKLLDRQTKNLFESDAPGWDVYISQFRATDASAGPQMQMGRRHRTSALGVPLKRHHLQAGLIIEAVEVASDQYDVGAPALGCSITR